MQVITPAGPEAPVKLPPALLERTLTLLMAHCESDEEGVRNVVADCLGKLTLLDAARLLPALQVHLALTPPPLSVVTLDAGPHSAAPTALTHTVGRHPEQVRQCKGAEVYSETSSGEGVPIDPKLTRAGIKPPARGGMRQPLQTCVLQLVRFREARPQEHRRWTPTAPHRL